MSLLEHLREAARHLKEATQMARDFRVKEAAASAGTVVNCAVHTEEKIVLGKAVVETRPSFERPMHD